MPPQHIHHLTITTGDSRRSWRHEIQPHVVAPVRALLMQALATGRVELAMVQPPGYWLRVSSTGRCLIATVMHGDDLPLVTFGIAAHSRCGARLWRLLASGATVTEGARHLNPDRAPQEPWCAARIEPGLAYMPDSAVWLGDLERCIAWAWLDHLEDRRHAD